LPRRALRDQWSPSLDDRLFSLTIMGLCDRLRLMFFGNLYQDWSEFVLADLGILPMKKSTSAPIPEACAAARTWTPACSCTNASNFEAGEALADCRQVNALTLSNPWLQRRREKLLFQIAQHCERIATSPLRWHLS
jgi:hypothetical protein